MRSRRIECLRRELPEMPVATRSRLRERLLQDRLSHRSFYAKTSLPLPVATPLPVVIAANCAGFSRSEA
jgi:hypothetical protein